MTRKMTVYYNYNKSQTEFYDETGALITEIHENDGQWRSEYMNCLMEHFDVEVEKTEVKPKKPKKIKKETT